MNRPIFASVALWLIYCEFITSYELILDRVELLNSSYLEGYYNISLFRVNKYNRTTFVLNYELELFRDWDQTFLMEMNLYYNRLNNNQYQLSLLRLQKQKCCEVYRKYRILNDTFVEAQAGLCSIKKVNFQNKIQI